MSNLTVCRECNTPNTPGSKFCNNCGARLPLGTNLICPNCETSNPRNRVFCDNCGTRLVKEETPKAPGKPEEPTGGTKAFSLPARPPGETGELDPNTLPDWLKTGDTGAVDSDHVTDDQTDELPEWLKASLKAKGADPDKLPRLEELTPEKRTTDDLPDWLVSEGDTSPIIDSPKEISTEIYLDLVSRAEDTPDPDEPFDASQANLPDWLAEAASFPDIVPHADSRRAPDDSDDPAAFEPPAEPEPVDDARPLAESPGQADDQDLTDWLAEPDALAQSPPAGEAAGRSGLTDWLTDPDAFADPDEAGSAGAAGLTDWLVEAEDGASDSDSELADSASGLTGWLTEPDLDPDTDPTTAKAAGEAELADWLADLDQLGEAGDVDAGEEEGEANILFEETAAAGPMPEATDAADASPPEGDVAELLPDWLADGAAEDDTLVAADETDEEFDDLFAAEPITTESELAWLAASGGPTLEDEESDDWLAAEPGETSQVGDEATAEPEQRAPAADLGWLDELAAFDSDAATARQTIDTEEQPEGQYPEDIPTIDGATTAEPSEPEPTTSSATTADPADNWLVTDSFSQDDPLVEEELPDWLEHLGPPVSSQPPESGVEDELREEPLLPSEDLPEWIASLRPNSSLLGSSLPSALSSTSPLPEPLQDIPEELAGAELPEWLQDLPISETTSTPAEEGSDIPDWLVDLPEGYETSDIPAGQEWDNILGDLPPAVPLEQTLARADIPDWVQALKPRDLLTQPPVAQSPLAGEPEEPKEAAPTSGPLAGMQGVVAIEPVILKPRTESAFDHLVATLSPTPAQQEQVTLLRQLARSEPGSATAVMPKTARGLSPLATSLWLRLLLAGILIATILLGLLVPDLVIGMGGSPTAPAPASVESVYTVVEAAAGRPVLVAFDYTPALAGELTPHANLLLAQLEANGSAVLTVSQYAAGTAVAASTQAVPRQDLGYLAGEAVGLRQLGNCLSHQITCETVPGWAQHVAIQPALSDVALIIVLTGERNTLVNWVEQVGTNSEIPIVAAITQALAPVAAPYVATGQLEAVLAGTTADTVYEERFGPGLAGDGRRPFAVQPLAQLVAAALLLIGSLIYGISGTVSKRSTQQTKT